LKAIWLHIIFIFCAGTAYPQEFPDLRFSHLTDKDGLSNDNVTAITQDQDGLIWIGTQNGLNRFDGYGFKKFYANANDPKSMPNSFLSEIVPDRKNNLWVSCAEGIFYFNTKTQVASTFKSNPEDTSTFRNQHGIKIYLDSTQLPWLPTRDGLYHFTDSAHYTRMNAGMEAFTPLIKKKSKVYGEIVRDRTGQLWSFWDNTIFKLDKSTKKVLEIYSGPEEVVIMDLFFDSYGRCWVSTWGMGIFRFTPEQNQWLPFKPTKASSVVRGAAEWEINGRKVLVFTCSSPGLLFVDEGTLAIHFHAFDAANVAFQGAPFVDRQNILWIPTTDGIYFTTPSNNLFSIIPVPPLKNEQSQSMLAFVYNMKEEKSGYWLAKRYNGGILWYDRNWKLIKSWLRIPVGSGKRFPRLGPDSEEGYDFKQVGDDMFITTEGGISILNLHTFQWTTCSPSDVRSPPRLRTLIAENEQTWWVRSFDQGVFIFNPLTRQFSKHYRNDDTCAKCLPGNIHYLIRDKKERVFATTSAGLFQYDKSTDRFQKIILKGKPLPSVTLVAMAEDEGGLLWIGADNGLFAVNPENGKIEKTFSENNKIGFVFRICTDDAQNIWFCSNGGFWCWLRKQDKIIHFEYDLGLPKIGESVFYKALDGSVYGGGKDALVRFDPGRLMNYRVTARTKMIEAFTNDTLAPFTLNSTGQKELTLSPDENSIHLTFDVINYDLIGNNQFYYKLDPGDKGWKQNENGRLSFYNLQPGTYRLEVKGASRLTGNFTNTDSLNLTIRPYWYQSNWFKVLCLLLTGLIISYIVRYRFRIVRKEAAFKQKITEIEMTALRAQMNPHFIFNSLNSIENFIMQNEKRLASDYLNKFARLIRMILENSRKQLVPLAKDMEAMQLYVDLEQLRYNNKFCYLTDIDDLLLSGDYRVAPLLIQPFVENAIIHGLAPSDRKDLYLRISVRLYNDYIHYTIEDNGIGRLKSMAYAEQNKTRHKSLGLEITRERINIINRQQGSDSMLEIVDLQDQSQHSCGTRIILTIKTA
jgi:ligand-binding sensor domain-containing protein